MKAIKITAHQQTANYRVPNSFRFRESYPLPPYSTVIGMVHNLCGFNEYHPMHVSVQGKFTSSTVDMFTRYEFANKKYIPKEHALNADGTGIIRGPGNVQLLTGVDLLLHIMPDDPNELEQIYQSLKYPRVFPSLGRHEDLIIFRKVEIVELGIEKGSLLKNRNGLAAYIPQVTDNVLKTIQAHTDGHQHGTRYLIRKNYRLTPVRNGSVRTWEMIPVTYTDNYVLTDEETVCELPENEGEAKTPVFFG